MSIWQQRRGQKEPSCQGLNKLSLVLAAALAVTSCDNAYVDAAIGGSLPAAPTNLTASVNGDSVSLNWSPVSNASGYEVYRDDSLLAAVTTNSFSESGLANGTYLYVVAAINDVGESQDRASVSVNVADYALPAPGNLTASVSGDGVSLNWDALEGASGYSVYRDGSLLETISTNSFAESGLADGTYFYEVAAVSDSSEAGARAGVSVVVDTDESPPAAPAGLTATVSGTSVNLSWDADDGASSYRIYRDGSFLTSTNATSLSESGLADGSYFYEVSSVNDYGESADRAGINVVVDTNEYPPAAPTGLIAEVSGASVTLTWNAVSDASNYQVYRDGDFWAAVSANSFSESELDNGDYFYEISAVNDAGESTSKASVSVTIDNSPPAAPTGLTAAVSGESVNLTWNAVSGASSYQVYRDGSLLSSVTTNSFSDDGLANGTYLYEVSALGDYGESEDKANVSVTIDNSAPAAPTGLTAAVSNSGLSWGDTQGTSGLRVSLNWNTVHDASLYLIYRDGNLLEAVNTNSFSEDGVADGVYLYELSSVSDYGESADRASVIVTVNSSAPESPTGLTASVNGDSVELSWDAVADATGYNVYRDGSLLEALSSNSFSDSGVADGTYLYEVSALNDYGEGAKASVSASVNNAPPDAPTNLNAIVNGDSVSLSWTAVADATSYNLYRDGGLIASPSTNSFNDGGLADGTYLYEVLAVDDAGESTSKASVSATVNNAPPAAPTNLNAAVNGDSVSLSWTAVADATSYNLYRDGSLIASPSTNSFNDTSLADATYLYEVSAVDDAGESTSKASVSASVNNAPPAAPTNLSAAVNGDSVSLSWDAVADATSYNLYRDGSLIASPSTNSFNDSGLADGTYLYEVSAVDDAGESTSKASVSATVNNAPPDAPTNLNAAVNGDSVSLSWDAVADATSYNLYRDGALIASPTANSYSEINLANGSYLYEVSSVSDIGESQEKASVTASVSADPLYAYQWHLHNTGQNAFATFPGTSGEDINYSSALALGVTGDGVRINVIDSGLEIQHPDLQANVVAGGSYNYLDGGSDPTNNTDTGGDHGTSVAGLIAADGSNGIGVAGVAGKAQLQGYNVLALESTTYSDYIFAHGGDEDNLADTDIFNKSLGSEPTSDSRIYSALLDALSCFTTGGSSDMSSVTAANSCDLALRSGLGAIYVKSAGNGFTAGGQICDSVGLTCWNVNMEAEDTYPYQIIVGALNAEGEKSSYSSAGSAIWISAPGGEYGWDYEYMDAELSEYGYGVNYDPDNSSDPIAQPAMVTVDQVGCNRGYTTGGYDFGISGVPPISYTSFHEDDDLNANCEYTSTFNGTSSAAPVVSGVIALILEANPGLSWRDVKHILASSARQVDSGAAALEAENIVCSNSSCSSSVLSDSLSFVVRDAWITNAAGYSYHNWYGFGSVNAGAAVAMAQTYSSSLGAWQKNSYSQSPSVAIPDSTGASAIATLTVNDGLTIEAVQLDLSITHTCIFELAIVLHSPSGTRSVLLSPYNQFNCDQDFSSTLLSNAFYGESSVGDWRVEVYDIWETSTGSLDDVTLNIYGH